VSSAAGTAVAFITCLALRRPSNSANASSEARVLSSAVWYRLSGSVAVTVAGTDWVGSGGDRDAALLLPWLLLVLTLTALSP